MPQEKLDLGKWKCPACGSEAGVDFCEMVPTYYECKIVNGIAVIQPTAQSGAAGEFDAIRCVECRETVEISFKWEGSEDKDAQTAKEGEPL